MSELKPCPFSTGKPHDLMVMSNGQARMWMECMQCGACGPMAGTRAEAIAAWNRRASPPEDVRRMREALEVIAHAYHDLGPRDFAALARVTAKNALAEKETER